MSQALSTDVLIVGGGIAGLWLNARLRRQGFATLLVDNARLGGGQSVKSQGIIHGGAKYALHGALTGASEAIADMPRRWREALAGTGELDLSGVRLLSDAHYLWSPGSLAGNITSFFASKAVRGRVDQVTGEQLPPALQHPKFKGKVYRLAELVLDVPSLISRLSELAGDGLLAAERIEPLYAHCLGGGPKPRVTITTHPAADGQWVWYLGGDLAEADGVARDEAAQIQAAKKELSELLPWVDLSAAQWATLRVDRAEPAQSGLARPDNAFLHEQGKLLVGWPTKLALAPDFADRVLAALSRDGVQPTTHAPLPALPRPSVAPPVWEELF